MADGTDDLLDPSEIEALLKSAGALNSAPASQPPPGGHRGAAHRPGAGNTHASPEELLEQVEANLAAAVGDDYGRGPAPDAFSGAMPFELESFAVVPDSEGGAGLKALEEVELDLRIELGRTELLIEEVLRLREGSVVPLDKLAGDPVDILANGRLIARGEVLVLNDNFCVRVAEILAPTLE